MKTLALTSPHMTGPNVLAAQKLLTKNPYGSFYSGALDSDCGDLTAQSFYLAKYFLGYSLGSCTKTYGTALNNILTGKSQLSAAQKTRRTNRLAVVNSQPLREKAYKKAVTQIGVKESPSGSNQVLYSKWYGITGPWCAMFATWCYVGVGSKAFIKGSKYSYVPYMVDDARATRNSFKLTSNPQQGDLVCYDWDHDGNADHVGLFEKWTSSTGFTAIEGNTALGNDSNGGEVMRRDRIKSEVVAFITVEK